MDLLNRYLTTYTKPPVLGKKNTSEYHFTHPLAHMFCGDIVGQFLQILVRIRQPEYVLELGTMLGYSTLCLATYLPEKTVLHTIEMRENDFHIAEQNIALAGLSDKVVLHCGDILTVLETNTLPDAWDLIFLDSDKKNYIEYYEYLLPKLRIGGIIIADNALFHQRVLNDKKDKNAQAVHNFNKHVRKDARVDNVLLNVRDGLQLIIKIKN